MSDQELINAAKAPTVAYNKKDWNGVRAAITAGFVYDEVATQSKAAGADQVIEAWRGWATALPDSNASFESAFVSGDKVVVEMTWRGKHTGPMQSPKGGDTGHRQKHRDSRLPDRRNRRRQGQIDAALFRHDDHDAAIGAGGVRPLQMRSSPMIGAS